MGLIMGRKGTGTVRVLPGEHGPQWFAKWTRADGTRSPWEPLSPSIRVDDVAGAKAEAARLAVKVRRASATGRAVESVTDYADRWCRWREGRRVGCVGEDRTLLRRYGLDVIGPFDVRTIARDDLKRLVTSLDEKAKRGASRATRTCPVVHPDVDRPSWGNVGGSCSSASGGTRRAARSARERSGPRGELPAIG
jgi:hypothetical protein